MTKIAIVYYSMYGHIRALAQGIKKGIESADVEVQLFQVQETLPAEILSKMGAPPKSDDPVATPNVIAEFDGIIFGVSARYGGLSAQFHAFLDSTGSLWQKGALVGKPAGVFFSTANQGGGQRICRYIDSEIYCPPRHGLYTARLQRSKNVQQRRSSRGKPLG